MREVRPFLSRPLQPWLFLAPFLAVYALFLVYPFLRTLWLSLHDAELIVTASLPPVFLGLDNYVELLSDAVFWASLRHTVAFTLMAAPLTTVTGLALALVVHRPGRPAAICRAVAFTSGVLSVSVVTLVWTMVLNPSRGLLGQVAQAVGLAPLDPLGSQWLAMPALVVTTVWWAAGLPMALYLAGLQQIPGEVYEAAALDHASSWTTFRRITLPALGRTTWLVLLLEVLLHVQVFGQVLLMTRGGPANSTRVLVQYLYESSFRDWRVGYASAIAVVLFGFMALLATLHARLVPQED